MYKILLADDEGIVLESLRFIIEKHFKDEFTIEMAKSGRRVIELAESFHPDIAIIDIQMTGINGIEAMREIRKTNVQMLLIVLTAYDIFDYAKQSVNLGVMEYLNKPIQQTEIVEVLEKAMQKVDEKRELRKKELVSLEQIESLKPILENCFVDDILLQNGQEAKTRSLGESLGFDRECGYFLVIHFEIPESQGEITKFGDQVQEDASYIREQIKSMLLLSDKHIREQDIALGSLGQCRIPVLVGMEMIEEWGEHQRTIFNMYLESLEKKFRNRYHALVRIGVGKIYYIEEIRSSYYGAVEALEMSDSHICYQQITKKTKKTSLQKLATMEHQIQNAVMEGSFLQCRELATMYVENWKSIELNENTIKLKILEVVLLAEKQVYEETQLTAREDYLTSIQKISDLEELKLWFLNRLEEICHSAIQRKDHNSKSIIARGKEYIEENYQRDISLTDIAGELHISPHYFSRLFKEKVGMNYIEYLTTIRIAAAKKSLLQSNESIQSICNAAGYSDPNYFSRIFKKYVGMTPTEYKEGKTP